ncbi:flavin reductase family protein [Agrobacterium rosae]|uniref:flavin reductase family protein n=1 Tax=Agrobacterium rosae TaxID=1972867 RepID=UPI002034A501|nr:flavin reductase family protein [Agrobacterium rosae]MCM2436099.1 flavin reductase [Agrobacterium rosae]
MSDTIHQPIAKERFRSLMRNVAASVAVITTAKDDHLHGMTATAINSVSADPPTILIVVNKSARSHPLIAETRSFNINILSQSQSALSDRFAAKIDNQFDGITYSVGRYGNPILVGASAYLECETVAERDVASHTIFIGRVLGGGSTNIPPLVYHDGAYKVISDFAQASSIQELSLSREGWRYEPPPGENGPPSPNLT